MKALKARKIALSIAAATALVGTITTGAQATPTFGVSTTVSASCAVTTAPSALTPTYSGLSDTSVGSATTLATSCTGPSPTVTFSDAAASGTTDFVMTGSSSDVLHYQISNTTSCSGIAGDNPITEGTPQGISTGNNTYNICAAVTTGAGQGTATLDTYSDVVTFTINA